MYTKESRIKLCNESFTEEMLINLIKQQPDKFSCVYDLHYKKIFNYCFKRTKDFDASRDITSETFLKAFINFKKFKWKGVAIQSWLYRIATNEINLHYRSKKYRPIVLSELGNAFMDITNEPNLLIEKENAEDEMEKHKEFAKVQAALAKLPIKYQEAISLKYFEQLKIKEISCILNKPEGTVKSLLSRGLNLLKRGL